MACFCVFGRSFSRLDDNIVCLMFWRKIFIHVRSFSLGKIMLMGKFIELNQNRFVGFLLHFTFILFSPSSPLELMKNWDLFCVCQSAYSWKLFLVFQSHYCSRPVHKRRKLKILCRRSSLDNEVRQSFPIKFPCKTHFLFILGSRESINRAIH